MIQSEIKLIKACARTHITPGIQTSIQNYTCHISNWQKLIQIASFHRVLGLLYQNLKLANFDSVPGDIMSQLKKSYTDNAARNMIISSTLFQLLKLFNTHSIPAIPFKGPTIAQKAYGDINLRTYSDLDILIKKTDFMKAQSLLIQSGYRPEINLPEGSENKYFEQEDAITFFGKNKIPIDLHWDITGKYLLKPLYLEHFENKLQTISVLDNTIVSIPDNFTLINLCQHGTSHNWERLEWLCSFVELVNQQDEKSLNSTLLLAETIGAKRIFLLGLSLGQTILDAKYPESIHNALASDKTIRKFTQQLNKQIFQPKIDADASGQHRFSTLHIFIRDSFRDKLKYCIYLLTMPSVKEWRKYPLPLWLTPLYRIIRPIRLLAKYLHNILPRH